jgi:hypothetical protein
MVFFAFRQASLLLLGHVLLARKLHIYFQVTVPAMPEE